MNSRALSRLALPLSSAVALLALTAPGFAQGPGTDYMDEPYGLPTGAHPDQVLDFYSAPGTGSKPVVVWLFGGGFHSGTEDINIAAEPFASWIANGWSVASVRYRHSAENCPEWSGGGFASYPDHIQDVSLAVQYLRKNNLGAGGDDLWDIDDERIVLYGRSAGGHMATWLAAAPDRAAFTVGDLAIQYPDGHGPEWSTRVRAGRNGGGPTDWTYDNPMTSPIANPYFGWFLATGCSQVPFDVAVSLMMQNFASPVWHAAQHPENQNVGFWHQFNGPIGGDQHDPEYGIRLHNELESIGSPVSYLNWDLGQDFPANQAVNQLTWLGLMNTSVPYGTGHAVAGLPPAISLLSVGAQDQFLVNGAPAGQVITLIVSVAPANVPFGGGTIYVDGAATSVTLVATANAAGEAVFSTGALAGAKGLLTLYAQAGWVQAGDFALTQGLRLHFEDL